VSSKSSLLSDGVQPARRHLPVPIDGSEQRPAGDLGGFEPGLERRDRAALAGQPRDAHVASLAFLVGLGAAQPQHEPVRLIGLHIGDVEPDELAAPERADEPNQQQRAIAEIDEAARVEGRKQPAQRVGQQRGFVGLLPAEGSADALLAGLHFQTAIAGTFWVATGCKMV
jgi:hypothetical protein